MSDFERFSRFRFMALIRPFSIRFAGPRRSNTRESRRRPSAGAEARRDRCSFLGALCFSKITGKAPDIVDAKET